MEWEESENVCGMFCRNKKHYCCTVAMAREESECTRQFCGDSLNILFFLCLILYQFGEHLVFFRVGCGASYRYRERGVLLL